MKSRLLTLGLVLSVLTFSLSCSKENKPIEKIELNTKGLSFNFVKDINIQLLQSKFGEKKTTLPRSVEPSTQISDIEAEPIVRPIVNPLIENGRKIHTELIQKLATTLEWNQLTLEERNSIMNFDDQQMAELSLIYTEMGANTSMSISKSNTVPRRLTQGEALLCVADAIGISQFKSFIEANSLSLMGALATRAGAIEILKIVGKRYLGWFGLAMAIYDFTNCAVKYSQD